MISACNVSRLTTLLPYPHTQLPSRHAELDLFSRLAGHVYPPRLAAADALSFYSHVFDTVEVNTRFRALPTESTVRSWYCKTPGDFTFA
jgi:hypothetical protein